MAMMIHAKTVKGKKLWYLYGGIGDETIIKPYPSVRSKGEMYEELRREFNLPNTTGRTDIVFFLFNKTWNGEKWVDDFTLQLKAHREKNGLTQTELAEKSGMSVQAVAALEQGTRGPSWETVLKLAHALEVNIEDFRIDAKSTNWTDANQGENT